MLSTCFLYRRDFPNDTNTVANIENALNIATSFIENWCDRTFARATYTEYLDGWGNTELVLRNYPIVSIYDFAPYTYNGLYLSCGSSVYSLNYRIEATQIVLTVIAFDGTETTNTLLFATYPTLDDLNTAINALPNITSSVDTNLINEPSRHLRQDNGLIISGQSDYTYIYKTDISAKYIIDPQTDNLLVTDIAMPFGVKNIYIKYLAGYILNVDNAQHTALAITGNVPKDLITVTNRFANVLLTDVQNGLKNYNLQSESLGDYHISLVNYNGQPISEIESFLIANKGILDRYRYKNLTW